MDEYSCSRPTHLVPCYLCDFPGAHNRAPLSLDQPVGRIFLHHGTYRLFRILSIIPQGRFCLTGQQIAFIIPAHGQPKECYNEITPNPMRNDGRCAAMGVCLFFGAWVVISSCKDPRPRIDARKANSYHFNRLLSIRGPASLRLLGIATGQTIPNLLPRHYLPWIRRARRYCSHGFRRTVHLGPDMLSRPALRSRQLLGPPAGCLDCVADPPIHHNDILPHRCHPAILRPPQAPLVRGRSVPQRRAHDQHTAHSAEG